MAEHVTTKRKGRRQSPSEGSKYRCRRNRLSIPWLLQVALLVVLVCSIVGIADARKEKEKEKEDDKDEEKEKEKEKEKKPEKGLETDDSIVNTVFSDFDALTFERYYYLEPEVTDDSSKRDEYDDTIVMQDSEGRIWITHDHGKKWRTPKELEKAGIVALYPNLYFNDYIFFITGTRKVYFSMDRGKTIKHFNAKYPPNLQRLQILSFHPNKKDWWIWTGAKECPTYHASTCHSDAYITEDRGETWRLLARYVRRCEFIKEAGRGHSEKLIYCEKYKEERNPNNNPLQLVASDDFFEEHIETHFEDVIDFATMSEFIIVAAVADDQSSLKVEASVDGRNFADALFPPNFKVPHQQAYTVLDSSTHSVFLHVTVNNVEKQEYGTIIKSNSNGTSYVLSLPAVNRDTTGYVDFEKMQGIEGVAIVNIVANVDDVAKGHQKLKKSMITHNDGGDWDLIPAPEKDASGKKYDCDIKDTENCSLHLHGYTERMDQRDTFSSPSAVGVMMGVGNVGQYLDRWEKGDTYITRDAGLSWHAVKEGTFQWEYGDQGSIIAIVADGKETNVLYYSLDEGDTWKEHEFSKHKMLVEDISTIPSDSSRQFLLWARDPHKKGLVTINVDFSGLADRKCKFNEENPEDDTDDYDLWSPRHPHQQDNCLFGHVAQYHRKKPDVKCYNGRFKEYQHTHNILKNCTCIRQDFECEFNYERQKDGSCALVPGLKPKDPQLVCKEDEDASGYKEPVPYRRIPITTCEGGLTLDQAELKACPGREPKFNDEHPEKRISAVGLFFAIVIPFAVAALVGWWLYNNWDGKFGRIRLDSGSQGAFQGDSPFVTYPIAIISGVVAVIAAIPLLLSSIWRSVSSRIGSGSGVRYTTRSSFARGRGDYAVVAENYSEDGELLGDDSDDEAAV